MTARARSSAARGEFRSIRVDAPFPWAGSGKVVGQNVDGNNLWCLLGNGRPGYVAARYVQNLGAVPSCG